MAKFVLKLAVIHRWGYMLVSLIVKLELMTFCNSYHVKPNQQVIHHRLPVKRPNRFTSWISNFQFQVKTLLDADDDHSDNIFSGEKNRRVFSGIFSVPIFHLQLLVLELLSDAGSREVTRVKQRDWQQRRKPPGLAKYI